MSKKKKMSKKEKVTLCILASAVGLLLFVLGLWGGSYVFHEIATEQGKRWMEMPTLFSGVILSVAGAFLAVAPWVNMSEGDW